MFRELNWQSLSDRWEKNKLIFMHQVKSNELPASMNNLFQIANPQANPAVSPGRGLLIPLGYLHRGKCEHSEVQSQRPCHGRSTVFILMRMSESSLISTIWRLS